MKGVLTEKIMFVLKERGITRTKFLEDLGLNRNQLRRWETGQAFPQQRTLTQIADYLLVDKDSLIDPDRDVEFTYTAKDVSADYFLPLSETEKILLSAFRNMSQSAQMRTIQAVLNIADGDEVSQ